MTCIIGEEEGYIFDAVAARKLAISEDNIRVIEEIIRYTGNTCGFHFIATDKQITQIILNIGHRLISIPDKLSISDVVDFLEFAHLDNMFFAIYLAIKCNLHYIEAFKIYLGADELKNIVLNGHIETILKQTTYSEYELAKIFEMLGITQLELYNRLQK